LNYFRAADGHRQAAIILEPHVGDIRDYAQSVFLAFYNVLGFSVELYLKSYLAGWGISSDVLSKKPYGHNLEALYIAAFAKGLTLQESAVRRIVELLNPNHSEYTYRYLTDRAQLTYIMPGEPIRLTFQVLGELHDFVGESIGFAG
jgi:hypothetical protein